MALNHVEDLKKEDFTIEVILQIFGPSPCLCRKGVPLMRMGCELDEIDIFIIGGETEDLGDGEKYTEPYTLVVQDHMFEDCYTYGQWETLDDFHKWFENPINLYGG